MDTSIELDFGDGKYRFWLPMAQIIAIEAGDKSIMEIWSAMSAALGVQEGGVPVFLAGGPARAAEIAKIIRHGLIGGGEGIVDGVTKNISPLDASRIVETYVHNRPLAETLPVAWAILQAAIFGVRLKKKADEPAGKPRPSGAAKSSRTARRST